MTGLGWYRGIVTFGIWGYEGVEYGRVELGVHEAGQGRGL